MEEDEYDRILCLIDELKSEDHATRIHAINSLETIAQAIGDERTREELIPYTSELLDNDNEEVLSSIAVKLGDLSKYVGDSAHMVCLLPSLTILAANEENSVREKAVTSLNIIAESLPAAIIEQHYLPMLNSLATNDWYSARIASCSLFSTIFLKMNSKTQEELIKLFVELGKDDTPMVRRAAAINLGNMCETVSNAELGKLFDLLTSDEHDSVRQMSLESISKVIYKYKDLIKLIKKLAKDKSWRVRYTLVENLNHLLEPFESAENLLNEIVGLLNDTEPEVKCIILSNLHFVIERLTKDKVEVYILPSFEKLAKDPSQYVRLSLVQAICQSSSGFGVDTSVQKLLPIINQLIRDESFDVRMSLADNLNSFNSSIGPEKVLQHSVPLILQMVKDNQWRLRLKVIECLPQVAEMIGLDDFNDHISESMMKWIEDPVFAVREATLESIKEISGMYGEDWTKSRVLPAVQDLARSAVFVKRMTSLSALNKFGDLLGPKESYAILETLSNDPVPNIKFNVAKTIKNKYLRTKGISFAKVLEKLKNDPDFDVKYYAEQALKEINYKS
jgi:serine/threonine-protein phosphatase 2A regulatory subunit A